MIKIIKALFWKKDVEKEISEMKEKRKKLDKRVRDLEVATVNGDEQWMVGLIRRKDASCAMKVLTECDDANQH